MKLQTKNIPLALFALFCLKTLFLGFSYESVAGLAVLGSVAFLYESFIQNKQIHIFHTELDKLRNEGEASKKELEQVKAYVSSLKLNSIRGGANGFNRTAQS